MPGPRKIPATNIPYHADILEMALSGYEAAKMKIETEILALRKMIGAASRSYAKSTAPHKEDAPKKRTMSSAARKRIAAAQKKRWDAVRAAKATPSTKRVVKKKGPKLTREERQRLSAGQVAYDTWSS